MREVIVILFLLFAVSSVKSCEYELTFDDNVKEILVSHDLLNEYELLHTTFLKTGEGVKSVYTMVHMDTDHLFQLHVYHSIIGRYKGSRVMNIIGGRK